MKHTYRKTFGILLVLAMMFSGITEGFYSAIPVFADEAGVEDGQEFAEVPDLGGEIPAPEDTVPFDTGDIIVGDGTGEEEVPAVTVTVSFDMGGHGEDMEAVEVEAGGTMERPVDPQEDGFTFIGWYMDPSFETAWDFDWDTVDGDMTLYALWEETEQVPEEQEQDGEALIPGGEFPAVGNETVIEGTAGNVSSDTETENDETAGDGTEGPALTEYPAFSQSRTVNGVVVTVSADAGVFPEDAVLSVIALQSAQVDAAIEEEQDPDQNIAVSYTFDITVLDADGNEIQPAERQTVNVSFSTEEVADVNLDTQVYHISDDGSVEELDVDTSGETAIVETDGFSEYSIVFTYNSLKYVMQAGTSVPLKYILAAVGLSGEITDAACRNLSVFQETSGEWYVNSVDETPLSCILTVKIIGISYDIEIDVKAGDSPNYNYPNGFISGIPATRDGYVWMGVDGGNPVKWLVIGRSDSHYLLISAEVLGGMKDWESAKSYVDSIYGNFSPPEKEAVEHTNKDDRQYDANGPSFREGKLDADLFLLSAEEAETYFSGNGDRAAGGGWWWLRSLSISDGSIAGVVDGDGEVRDDDVDHDDRAGARPAFQLNRESVLFESAAEGGKSSADAGGGEFGNLKTSSERKLTLIDKNITDFSASASSTTVSPGGSLAVSYSGASTGTGKYVSAVLCDSSGAILYYASLTPESSGSGTWNMTIPADLAEGNYTFKVFSEQQNGDKMTDYASTPSEISLKVAGSYSVTVNNGTTENSPATTGDTMTIKANDPKDGEFFKSWTSEDGVVFADSSKSTTTFTMPAQAVEVTATYEDIPNSDEKQDIDLDIEVTNVTYPKEVECIVTASVDGEYALAISQGTGDSSVTVCSGSVTVSNGQGTFNAGILDAGNYSATVSFPGNDDYNPASVSKEFRVYKGDIGLFVAICDEVYGDDIECLISANVDGEYELTVAGKMTTVTVKDHLAYYNAGVFDAGSYQASINFTGDNNYNPAFNTTRFTVYRSDTGTSFEVSAEPAQEVEGGTIRIVPTLPNGATGTVKYYLGCKSVAGDDGRYEEIWGDSDDILLGELSVGESLTLQTSGDNAFAPLGTHVITAEYSGDSSFLPAKEIVLVTIIPKPSLTITVKPQTYTYNGSQQGEADPGYEDPAQIAEKVEVDGLVDGDALTNLIMTGSQTEAGVYKGEDGIQLTGFTINGDPNRKDAYNVTIVPGTLTIKPAKATITVDSTSKVVGEDDPSFTGSVSGLIAEGDLGEIAYKRSGTDEEPGTYNGVLTATYKENDNYDVTVVPGDFTIKAILTLRWLDGDSSVLQEKTYVEGETAPAYDGKEPTKAETAQYAYAFSGWDDGTTEGTVTTFRPQFEETLKQYSVTFVDYDGKTVLKGAVSYDYGTAAADIALPDDPERKADAQYSYTFTGWTPELTEVTSDAVYTAVYASDKQKYTVTWLQDDGTQIDKTTVEYGETPVHADPVKAADAQYTYAFAGWDPEITEVTGDATYKATYTATPVPAKKGILTFDLGGGTLNGKTGKITIEANVGDTIKLPGAPTREGYTFLYWKGSKYEAGAEYKVEGDHTFTAEWEENKPVTYTVTFNVNGRGTAPAAQIVEAGKKAVKPADPTASGYTFGGWFTDQGCTKAFDFNTAITQDITLYAKWTVSTLSAVGVNGTSVNGTIVAGAKTGDSSHAGIWAGVLAGAAVCLAVVLLVRRRYRRK